ncbi:MAG: chitobiase/beta-hexosaminidase C-terminal domain-containing protein, partial [Bacteroidales bacterium]|nr:chitobiase/beta-hexosaminidase C-terminal domain-containing protein [Bacteroidales bacterium]
MKKLTWLFLSLMLLLGLGTAFADEEVIPAPTLNPNGGEVTAGTKVKVTTGFEDTENEDAYQLYYVVDNPNFDFSQYEDDENIPSYVKECYGTITVNAAMTVKVATVKIEQTMEGNTLTWSDPVSASYTIKAVEPTTPTNDVPAPTFNPDGGEIVSGGKVILTNGTESDATPKPIFYNIKGTGDEEFKKATTKAELAKAVKDVSKKLIPYPVGGIELTADRTINAATADTTADKDTVIWSTVVTRNFTIGSSTGDDDNVAAPTFSPDGGEVDVDEDITMTTTTQGAKIYYINGTTASFVSLTTEEALDEAANGLISTAMEYANYSKPTLGEFIGMAGGFMGNPGDKLSLTAAAVLIAADGSLTWSEVTTREFTVKADDTPVDPDAVAIPVITPANDAIVHMGDLVTIECETEGAEIYYATDGTNPYTTDKDGYPVAVKEGALKYTEPFALTQEMLIKQRTVWALKVTAVAVKGDRISENGA